MRKVSDWAGQHIIAARLLLTILHIFLVVLVMLLCPLLAARNITVSFKSALLVCTAGFSIVLATGYIKKSISNRVKRFRLQKMRFMLTGICCLVLITGFFSSGVFLKINLYSNLNGAFTEKAAKMERPTYESYSDKKLFYEDLKKYYTSFSKKELRKELRHQLRDLVKGQGNTQTTSYIVGILLAMLFALFFVAIVSCNISCNGSEVLGTIIFIVGVVGAIGLAAYLIIRRLRKKKIALKSAAP